MVSDGSGARTRPTVFPYLIIELVDDSGTPIGSRLVEDWDALVSDYNLAPASSLLSKLNSSKSVESKEYDKARSSHPRDSRGGYKNGIKRTDFNKISHCGGNGGNKLPRGISCYTGFFDPIEIYDNGKLDLLI